MITCKICGSFKVENKELKLCASHNREQRKPRPEKAKIKPLAPLSEKMQARLSKRKKAITEAAKQRRNNG